ncbi:MAG: phosphatase PAP2 family protein [Sporomusaceae bacterium]|nr:phosphatase PAP2 family protein [Sporomusaceae bacterium]
MNSLKSQQLNGFRLAWWLSVFTGAVTSGCVYAFGPSGDARLFELATQLGGIGNDLFLLLTNAIIFNWAWRRKLRGVIRLTLFLDIGVWLVVQSVKLIPFGDWALRPNGEIGGFPSGHTTHAFAMAFALTTLFPRYGWFWHLCAGVIAWSRVESDWHSPLQVTAGVFLGIGAGVIFIRSLWKKTAVPAEHPGAAKPFIARR